MFKKENFTLIAVIAGIIILGATGFLLWRINQTGSLSSEDSDASSKLECGEYGCTQDSDCEGPETGVDYECDEVTSHTASKQKCERISCPTGYEMADNQCDCDLVDSTCDGGGWTSKPTTVTAGSKVTISGYGQDVSGIDSSSIVIKVDGSAVSSSTVSLTEGSTVTSWSVTVSGLSVGSHTVAASWADTKGNTGTACTLSTTFTVAEAVTTTCSTLWWYNSSSTACKQSEFCDSSSYEGKNTYSTQAKCETALAASLSSDEDTTDTTPQTGILDEPWGKIALGFIILSVGLLFTKFNIFEMNWKGVEINGNFTANSYSGKMNNFEKKLVKNK